MKRDMAIETIMTTVDPSAVVISTTGLISREIFERYDSERNVYVPGSMGLASSIGLGIAVSRKDKRVVVVDGDSSLLMNLGSVVTIGNKKPENLLHIVIDNGAYGSCSEEASMSGSAHLDKLARVVGYGFVRKTTSHKGLKHAILSFGSGPGFILAKIGLGGRRDFQRPLDLPRIKARFMAFLEK
jgi:phosphonopyruvate decarboxylase